MKWLSDSMIQAVRRGRTWASENLAVILLAASAVAAVIMRDAQIANVPDYLGSVVALETTAVAIMVPVVLSVALQVYQDYNSREVRFYLLMDRRLTALVVATFVNALAAVAALALHSWAPTSGLFVPFSFYAIFGAFSIVFILLQYLGSLRDRILSEPDWLIERITDDALSILGGSSE